MSRFRHLLAACLLGSATLCHAAPDAEVRQWLDELVGSALVLQELASGQCSGVTRADSVDIERWYSWGVSLASPAVRANTEWRKSELLAQARASVSQWVANEFGRAPASRPLQRSCTVYAGIFRTIRDAAESELEDIEYAMRGRVTPREQR